ncbi:MAG: hypothetical protein AB7D28_09330 [Candidatus Berkiella sp.]
MISSPTVWKNANTLTHDWEPLSSQQTLELSDNGRILVTHNLQSQIAKQLPLLRKSAPYQELMILIAHSKAVNNEVKKISAQLNSLPSTNLAEYQDKMSQYQGAINLLDKHTRFLQVCHNSLILKDRKDPQTKNDFLHKLSFKTLEKKSATQLENLRKQISVLRARQKIHAIKIYLFQATLVIPTSETEAITIPTTLVKIVPISFKIGSYAYQDQNYNVTISLALKGKNIWNQSETIHPASNELILKSVPTDLNSDIARIKFSVCWGNGYFPLLAHNIKTPDELFRPNYTTLFKNREKIQNNTTSLVIQYEDAPADVVHQEKLRQTLIEWMMHYNIDQLIMYDKPEKAIIYYGEGFSCDFSDHLPKSQAEIQNSLDHCLETRSYPTALPIEEEEERNKIAVPYIMRNHNIDLLTKYQFEKGEKKSYAELIEKEPVLDPDTCGAMPELMGIPRIPFCNLFETLRRREYTGRKATPDPIAIQATKLDYGDIERPTARRECSQISEHALQTEEVQIERRSIVKVRRCK